MKWLALVIYLAMVVGLAMFVYKRVKWEYERYRGPRK